MLRGATGDQSAAVRRHTDVHPAVPSPVRHSVLSDQSGQEVCSSSVVNTQGQNTDTPGPNLGGPPSHMLLSSPAGKMNVNLKILLIKKTESPVCLDGVRTCQLPAGEQDGDQTITERNKVT